MINAFEISMSPFRAAAKRAVPNYEKMSANELATGYCEAIDEGLETLSDGYMGALVLRFWSKISKLVMENPSLKLEYEDGYDWVIGAILQACAPNNRAWMKDPKVNASQVINQILATRYVAAAYYESNLQKNQGRLDQCSLDDVVDNDNELTVGELIEDPNSTIPPYGGTAVVQTLINNNKIVEAIIIDNVLTKNVFKEEKKIEKSDGEKYTKISKVFWPFKLVKELNELDQDYINDFFATYTVPKKIFMSAFNDVVSAPNGKKYKMIEKCQEYMRAHASALI